MSFRPSFLILYNLGPKSTIKNKWYWIKCHIPCLCLQSEDIRLEPELHDACKKDINKLCSSVAYGNAQVKVYFDIFLFFIAVCPHL